MKNLILSREAFENVGEIMTEGILSGFVAQPGNKGGYWVRKLEEEFKEYFNIKHAVAMNSATACLHSACLALDVKDKEVAVTPYSFVSSASCVLMAGGIPKFVDIDEDIFSIIAAGISITNSCFSVKNSIPVHLFGHPSMYPYGIEDCAQAIGAEISGKKVGTFGKMGVFSFNQSKTIHSGEGGMLITNDDEIAEKCRAIRNHAEVSNPILKMIGFNYRMGEMEAAIVYDQFQRLDSINSHRIELCEYVSNRLRDIEGITVPVTLKECKHVYWMYALKIDRRKLGMTRHQLAMRLTKKGLPFSEGYNQPLHLLPIFGGKKGDFPVTERMWFEELLCTQMFRPPMLIKQADKIIKKFKECLSGE